MTMNKKKVEEQINENDSLMAETVILPDDEQVNIKIFDARPTVYEHFGKMHALNVNKQSEIIWSIGVDAVISASQK